MFFKNSGKNSGRIPGTVHLILDTEYYFASITAMARMARIVIPNNPHHILHRGNRREKIFLSDDDKMSYVKYLQIYAKSAGIDFWAYCLMDNHVHFIAVPREESSFASGFKEAHKHYTRMINFRENWCGHLWEGRYKSHVLSEKHLFSAIRYVERNPVRAGMVKKAEDYPWSSARAHIQKTKDTLLSDNFVIREISDWESYLTDKNNVIDESLFAKHANTGRPLGESSFIDKIEKMTGRLLHKKKPGPKREKNN